MKDNEIIKALERCGQHRECCYCNSVEECGSKKILVENAIDLINRQKAEIERLSKEEKALLLTIEAFRKERVRIQTILVNFMDEIYVFGNKNNVDTNSFAQIAILGCERDSAVKKIKSEAVKEFAERLKNEIISDTSYGCDSSQHSGYYDYTIKIGDIPEYIDNLVKEMTEQSVNYGSSKTEE